ncbi:MAG TPA: MoaD/ThiS family protein [bacterium]|nr:MoaD/ThiS family protein [bacterium]
MFGSGKKPKISIHVKVAGFIDGKVLTAEFDLEAPAGVTVKELFKLVDKSGRVKGNVMKKILALPRPPTVLVNGSGLDLPDELGLALADGDEVAVMTPLAGG